MIKISIGDFKEDLFDGQLYTKKERKARLFDKYSKYRFLPYIKVSIENIVIFAIGVSILVIIAYAFGVEKGKRTLDAAPFKTASSDSIAKDKGSAKQDTEAVTLEMLETDNKDKELELSLYENTALDADSLAAGENENAVQAEGPKYVVRLASFKSKHSAEEEAGKLVKKGISADLWKKGQWYQVYATGFKTMDEARKAQEKLIKEYKDCYATKIESKNTGRE